MGDHRFDVSFDGDIPPHEGRLIPKLGNQLLALPRPSACNYQPGPFAHERLGRPRAYPAGPAHDDGHLVVQSTHPRLSPRIQPCGQPQR